MCPPGCRRLEGPARTSPGSVPLRHGMCRPAVTPRRRHLSHLSCPRCLPEGLGVRPNTGSAHASIALAQPPPARGAEGRSGRFRTPEGRHVLKEPSEHELGPPSCAPICRYERGRQGLRARSAGRLLPSPRSGGEVLLRGLPCAVGGRGLSTCHHPGGPVADALRPGRLRLKPRGSCGACKKARPCIGVATPGPGDSPIR